MAAGANERGRKRGLPAKPLNHPLGKLFTFPQEVDKQLAVAWALGTGANVAAIGKKNYEELDIQLVEELLEDIFCNDQPVFAAHCFHEQVGVLKTKSKMDMCETYIKGLLAHEKKTVREADDERRVHQRNRNIARKNSETRASFEDLRPGFFSKSRLNPSEPDPKPAPINPPDPDPPAPMPDPPAPMPDPPAPVPDPPAPMPDPPAPMPDPPAPMPDPPAPVPHPPAPVPHPPAPVPHPPAPVPDPPAPMPEPPAPMPDPPAPMPDPPAPVPHPPAPVPHPPAPVPDPPAPMPEPPAPMPYPPAPVPTPSPPPVQKTLIPDPFGITLKKRRRRRQKKAVKGKITDAEVEKNRKKCLEEFKNDKYDIRPLRRRRRKQNKKLKREQLLARQDASRPMDPEPLENFELDDFFTRHNNRKETVVLPNPPDNESHENLLNGETSRNKNKKRATIPKPTPVDSSLNSQDPEPEPSPTPPIEPINSLPPSPLDSPPPRPPPSPPPKQIGVDYTPLQKQSILYTLAALRRDLDQLGLKDRPIKFTDLAPVQSTTRGEASVLATQLFELEKMRYLTVDPSTSSSVDPNCVTSLEIVLSDDFDYTVPEPKFL